MQKHQYFERYRPLKFQICIEMSRKYKFQMALIHLKTDYFEILGGHRELNVLQKYFWSISIKFLWGVHLSCHIPSPTIYSKYVRQKICKKSIVREIQASKVSHLYGNDREM